MFRTSNPAFRNDVFGPAETWDSSAAVRGGEGPGDGAPAAPARPALPNVMTLQGTVNKSLFVLTVCVVGAVVGWNLTNPIRDGAMVGSAVSPVGFTLATALIGFGIAVLTFAKPRWSVGTTPLYALVEGGFVGAVSSFYAMWAAGRQSAGEFAPDTSIVMQAGLLTFGTFGAMLIAYTTRLIRPTQRFRSITVAATGGIALTYLVSIGLSFFGMRMPFLHDASPIGIGISLVVIAVAAMNLVLDFEFVETGVRNGAPKWAEWYAGFGMLVTLVWLYLEFLRLLSKLRRS